MNTKKLKQYADIKAKVEKLKEQEEALRLEILNDMQASKITKEETAYGKFTVASRKAYIYSDKVDSLVEKLAIAKNKEVERGIAIASVTNYLVYKSNV